MDPNKIWFTNGKREWDGRPIGYYAQDDAEFAKKTKGMTNEQINKMIEDEYAAYDKASAIKDARAKPILVLKSSANKQEPATDFRKGYAERQKLKKSAYQKAKENTIEHPFVTKPLTPFHEKLHAQNQRARYHWYDPELLAAYNRTDREGTAKDYVWNWISNPHRQEQLSHALSILKQKGYADDYQGDNSYYANNNYAETKRALAKMKSNYDDITYEHGNEAIADAMPGAIAVFGGTSAYDGSHYDNRPSDFRYNHPTISLLRQMRKGDDHDVVVHEFTHGTGLDEAAGREYSNPLYRGISDNSLSRDIAETLFDTEHGMKPKRLVKRGYKYIDPISGKTADGAKLHGTFEGSFLYGTGVELLPNVMALRSKFRIKPNEVITPEKIFGMRTIMENEGGYNMLFDLYDDNQIADMFNSFVRNDRQQQPRHKRTMLAQKGTKFPFPKANTYENWRGSLPTRLQHEGDYDLRGMYDEEGWVPVDQADQHFTDRHKKPNHPTFSNESKYHNTFTPGGKWTEQNKKWQFNPTSFNLKMIGGKDKLQEYFKHNDPSAKPGPMSVYPYK